MPDILFHTPYLDLKSTESSGKTWYYAHRPNAKGAVCIVPVIEKDGKAFVLALETYRPAVDVENLAPFCIEWPAGLVGDERVNESVLAALRAELLEETGYEAETIKVEASRISASAGIVTEMSTLAIAFIQKEIVRVPLDDDGTIVKRHLILVEDLFDFVKEKEEAGYSVSYPFYAGICFLYKEGILR